MESILLEQTEQFWSPLSSVGMVPKVLGYFGIQWTCVFVYLGVKDKPDCTLRLGYRGMEIIKCGISLLGRKFIGMVI